MVQAYSFCTNGQFLLAMLFFAFGRGTVSGSRVVAVKRGYIDDTVIVCGSLSIVAGMAGISTFTPYGGAEEMFSGLSVSRITWESSKLGELCSIDLFSMLQCGQLTLGGAADTGYIMPIDSTTTQRQKKNFFILFVVVVKNVVSSSLQHLSEVSFVISCRKNYVNPEAIKHDFDIKVKNVDDRRHIMLK
jgi:hypothetical protein